MTGVWGRKRYPRQYAGDTSSASDGFATNVKIGLELAA